MKNKRIILIIGFIISFLSFIFAFLYYKSNNSLIIYTSKDSYAYQYAKKNMINTYDVSDSHYKYFHRLWEDFKFNEESNGLVITKYEGISEELIIPTEYNNKKIIEIKKDALPSNVKKIFLPESVETIDADDYENIEILCYRGKKCEELKSNKKLKVKILDDVDRYILYEDKLEFTYNIINGNEIELTNYLGDSETIIIPETINGYKVTSILFDGEGTTSIFIPKTVNNIDANITSKLFNKCFIISCIIILLSFIIYFTTILLIKTFELIDKVYIYSSSTIYLFVISYIIFVLRSNPFEYKKYFIYSIIATIIYLITSYILNVIIKNNKKYDNEIKSKDTFIKDVKLILQDYDFNELKEIEEMIKYSDPVSINDVKEIEIQIKNELKNITQENIQEKVNTVKKLIKKRNKIIINSK